MQKLHLKDIVSQGSKKTNTQTWLSIGLAKLAGFLVSSVKCSATERQMTQGEAAAGQFWLQEATVFLRLLLQLSEQTPPNHPPSLPELLLHNSLSASWMIPCTVLSISGKVLSKNTQSRINNKTQLKKEPNNF